MNMTTLTAVTFLIATLAATTHATNPPHADDLASNSHTPAAPSLPQGTQLLPIVAWPNPAPANTINQQGTADHHHEDHRLPPITGTNAAHPMSMPPGVPRVTMHRKRFKPLPRGADCGNLGRPKAARGSRSLPGTPPPGRTLPPLRGIFKNSR